MFSLTVANSCIPKSRRCSVSRLSAPLLASSLIVGCKPEGKGGIRGKNAGCSRLSLGFSGSGENLGGIWRCRCERGGGEEGDVELEADIMKFMAESKKPTMFPTKKELIGAGRVDLVEAIEKRGGWYALGWDSENVEGRVEEAVENDVGEFQRRVEKIMESPSLGEHSVDSSLGNCSENPNSGDLDFLKVNASASLENPIEMCAEEDSGIEGILSRLKRQRNSDLGFDIKRNEHYVHAGSKDDIVRTDLERNGGPAPNLNQSGISNTSHSYITQNSEPETWRTWSYQRAGFQHKDFEAAEIAFSNKETDEENNHDGISIKTIECAVDWFNYAQINHSQIRSRLQQLESELATALYSLRSKRGEHISEEVSASSSYSQDLSDSWEFREDELMSAKERLRSIRAKLAVLEGKTALAMIDAQKILEMKQKKIDEARKAFKLFRTTCIMWPNSASEVLLAGSFDGWMSQRKMERSKMGIFSTCLKLYPGRYEIKFIVDGEWKVDPLRPIVKNNGYKNNLLIVS